MMWNWNYDLSCLFSQMICVSDLCHPSLALSRIFINRQDGPVSLKVQYHAVLCNLFHLYFSINQLTHPGPSCC